MAFSMRRRKPAEATRDSDTGRPCLKCRQKCPGFCHHSWRKICRHCKCSKSEHDILADDHERFVEKMIFEYYKVNGLSDFNINPAIEEYAWTPPALSIRQIEAYFDCLPKENVPIIDSVGDRYRIQQLLYQHPAHDYDPKFCYRLSEEEKKKHRQFSATRKKDAFGQATVRTIGSRMNGHECAECGEQLNHGELGLFASHAVPENLVWHPECFICCVCENGLVDLIYYYKDGEVYCGRHHADSVKPRCNACDEIIFTEECIQAHGRTWHTDHFVCYECECRLGSRNQYIMRDGQPYCCRCFESLYAVYCESCGEMIELNDGHMAHNDMHWHASDDCFSCSECNQSLLGKTFLPKHGKLYCSVACFKIGRMPSEYGGSEESLVEYSDCDINHPQPPTSSVKDIGVGIRGQLNVIQNSSERKLKNSQTNRKYWNRHEQDHIGSSEVIPESFTGASSGLAYSRSQKLNSYRSRDNNAEFSKNNSNIRRSRSRSNGHDSAQSNPNNQIEAETASANDHYNYNNPTKNPQHRKSPKQKKYTKNETMALEGPSSELKFKKYSSIDRIGEGIAYAQPLDRIREADQSILVAKGYKKSECITGSSSDDSQPDTNVTFNLDGKLDIQRGKSPQKVSTANSFNESRKEKKVRIVDEAVDKSKCIVM